MTKKLIYTLSAIFCFGLGNVKAQDLNFAEIRDLTKWYNPSIQQDKQASLSLNHRDVRYESLLAYRTTAGMFNLPLKLNSGSEPKGYWNFNLGFAVDQADQGILGTTQAQLGLSYALPINGNETFMAVSIQGAYVNSRLDLAGVSFPDQFDQNGPIANAVTQDPLGGGDSRKWFSSHLGISLFKQSEELSWNLGFSVRDITSPQVNRQSGSAYHLRPTLGLQAGCTFGENQTKYSFSGISNWKAQAFETLVAAGIKQELGNKNLSHVGFGLAYRLRDAFIPSVNVGVSQTQLSLFYDINVSGISAAGFKRNAFEIGLKHTFSKK